MNSETIDAGGSPTVSTPATFSQYLERQLEDPGFRAAFEDAQQKHRLLDSLIGLRRTRGLNQTQVAKRMGVGQSTVSGFETEDSDPRFSTLQRYARGVGAELRVGVSVPTVCDWIEPASGPYGATSPKVVDGKVSHLDTARRWVSPVEWNCA